MVDKSEFDTGPRAVRDVPLGQPGLVRRAANLYCASTDLFSHQVGQGSDVDGVIGTDVVTTAGLTAYQQGEEPRHEVRGVLVRTEWRTVSLHHHRTSCQCVPDEVAYGEVGVERHMRTDEVEETARDHFGISRC